MLKGFFDLRRLRIDLQRLRRIRLGLGQLPHPHLRDGEIVQHCRLVGVACEAPLQIDLRPPVLLIDEIAHPHGEVSAHILGIRYQHLLREGLRQTEVGAAQPDPQPLARRQAHSLLLSDPVHLPPNAGVGLVPVIKIVGLFALLQGQRRIAGLVGGIGPHPAHPGDPPLDEREHRLEGMIRDTHRIAVRVEREDPVRQRQRLVPPPRRLAGREAGRPRDKPAAGRHRQLVVPPKLEPQLQRDVRGALRLGAHPGAQRVRRADRQHSAVLLVRLAARAQRNLVGRGSRHHRKRLERFPLQGRRNLHRRVNGAIREQHLCVAALVRRLARVRVDDRRHLVLRLRELERKHERGRHDRFVKEHAAQHMIHHPEVLHHALGDGFILHRILIADHRDAPVVPEVDLHTDHAKRHHRREGGDEQTETEEIVGVHRRGRPRPRPEPERLPAGGLKHGEQPEEDKVKPVEIDEEPIVVRGLTEQHRGHDDRKHDHAEDEHPAHRRRRALDQLHIMVEIVDVVGEGIPALCLKSVLPTEEEGVGNHQEQPPADECQRHPPERDEPHERIGHQDDILRGGARTEDNDQREHNHRQESERRLGGQKPQHGRHDDRMPPVGRAERAEEKAKRNQREHQKQHRGRKHLPRPPDGIGTHEEHRALHKHKPHDPPAPPLPPHPVAQRLGQDFIKHPEGERGGKSQRNGAEHPQHEEAAFRPHSTKQQRRQAAPESREYRRRRP